MLDTTLSRRKALQVGAAAAGLTVLPARRVLPPKTRRSPSGTSRASTTSRIRTTRPRNRKTSTSPKPSAASKTANPGRAQCRWKSLPGDTSAFTKYRTASVAKNGPDIMAMWSGSYMLALKDFLEPMAPLFTAEERPGSSAGMRCLSISRPIPTRSTGFRQALTAPPAIFYNKELLDKAGVDPEGDWRDQLRCVRRRS